MLNVVVVQLVIHGKYLLSHSFLESICNAIDDHASFH